MTLELWDLGGQFEFRKNWITAISNVLCLYWVVDIIDIKRFDLSLSELTRLFDVVQHPDMRVVLLLNKCNECEEYEENLAVFTSKIKSIKFQDIHIETLNALRDPEAKISIKIDKHVIELVKKRYKCLNEYNTNNFIPNEVDNVLSEAELKDSSFVLEKNRSTFLF